MENNISISNLFQTSWKIFKSQGFLLFGLTLMIAIVVICLSFASTAGSYKITLTVVCLLVVSTLQMGYIKNMSQALDGEEPQFSAYKEQFKNAMIWLVTDIFVATFTIVGSLFLIIPGIYIAMRLLFVPIAIVENNLGIKESIKTSWMITKGHVLKILGFALVGILIYLLSFIFIIGPLFTIPMLVIATILFYRKLSNLYFNATISKLTEETEETEENTVN